MLKKVSTVAAVVAGLMMVGGPAFALAGEPHEHEHGNEYDANGQVHVWEDGGDGGVNDQFGLLNFADDSDVASGLNVCQVEVNAVLGIPILSNNDESACINTDNDDNDSHGYDG